MKTVRAAGCFLLCAAMTPAHAADDDAAALSLADHAPTAVEKVSDWRVFATGTWSASDIRVGGSERDEHLFIGVHYDSTIAPQWRAIFGDLLDLHWRDSLRKQNTVNTLIDAYVSWQPQPEQIVDVGRVNTRYGVAFGYNPTDYFRLNATRTIVSIDPASLRENRMGSVMLRAQQLWPAGALTALYSPKLADDPSTAPFDPDLGATNNRQRWLIAASHRISPTVNPQFLVHGGAAGRPLQFGLNATALPNDATVAYLEYSGGRSNSLVSQALKRAVDSRWRSQAAAGLTYTTPHNITLTLEYEYNGVGLGGGEWNALRNDSPLQYAQYRSYAAAVQEPPTTRRLFANARWQDAFTRHLDLSAFAYHDLVDHSTLTWLEARYRWTHVDAALQWQGNRGSAASTFGAVAARQTWQVLLTYFF